MSAPGLIRSRVPAEEYRQLTAINISRLKELKRSGLHYQHRLTHALESPALTLGTAAHCAVLEPERFARQFAVWSRRSDATGNLCPRTGQHWDRFVAENVGKEIITEDECTLALAISHAVRSDPCAMPYLETGEPEVVLEWYTAVEGARELAPCKGRVDWITHRDGDAYLVGLKSARTAQPMIFGTQSARLGYHLQWAFYFDGYKAITGRTPKMREIVVESAAPHDVVVFNIPEDVIAQGREEYETLLRHLRQCEDRGEWLGVAEGREQVLTLPTWAYPAQDDLTDLGLE